MKRTDDQTILEMKRKGRTGKEIATYFGVSPAFISKRLKVLRPPPESFEKLTDKQKKFVLAKTQGKSNTDAALEAFDVTNRDSAKSLGYNMMKNADVNKAIQELMAEEGLTRRHIIRRLKDLVDHPDGHVAARGIDMSMKAMNAYPREEKPAPQVVISGEKLELIFQTLIETNGEEEAKRFLRNITTEEHSQGYETHAEGSDKQGIE
jgi:hypothetical protein